MKIENIIYDTTRSIINVEDKLRIATIFIFCEEMGAKIFAELLYTDDHKCFIDKLSKEHNVDLAVNLSDKGIKECFFKTLESVKKQYDKEGYYKALYEDDPFAIVIDELVNYDFNDISNY